MLVGKRIVAHRLLAQWTDSGLMTVLQWTVKPRVVAIPQAGESAIAKNATPHRQDPTGEREHVADSLIKGRSIPYLADLARPEKVIALATSMPGVSLGCTKV